MINIWGEKKGRSEQGKRDWGYCGGGGCSFHKVDQTSLRRWCFSRDLKAKLHASVTVTRGPERSRGMVEVGGGHRTAAQGPRVLSQLFLFLAAKLSNVTLIPWSTVSKHADLCELVIPEHTCLERHEVGRKGFVPV